MWTVHVLLIPSGNSGWLSETVGMNRYDRILNDLAQQQPRQLFKWAISRLLWSVCKYNNYTLKYNSIDALDQCIYNRQTQSDEMSWRRPVMWWYTQVDAMPMMIERLTVWFMCTKCIPGKRRLINVADIVQLRRHHLWSLSVCVHANSRRLLDEIASYSHESNNSLCGPPPQQRPSPTVHAYGVSGKLTYCEEMCWWVSIEYRKGGLDHVPGIRNSY